MKLVLVAALLIFSFQNCSKVQFAAQSDSDLASLNSDSGNFDGGSSADGTNGVDGGINGGGGSTDPIAGTGDGRSPASEGGVVELPHVAFTAPFCAKGTSCLGEFTLSKAMPEATSFYWKTNDSAYLTPSTDSSYIIGQPNVHYVPKGPLLITFAPGETKKQIYVQNINQTNNMIFIPVRMDQCVYAGVALNCTDIF